MKKLIKDLEFIFNREYPKSKFKIDCSTGSVQAESFTVVHGLVLLGFTINDKRIDYRYLKMSHTISPKTDNTKKIHKAMLKDLRKNLLNNTLFGLGEMSISSLLSGESKPNKDLIVTDEYSGELEYGIMHNS